MAARWDLDRARECDAAHPLGGARARFIVPDGLIYLDGNSLGALPARVSERVRGLIETEWGVALGTGWNNCGWMEAPERVGDRIAPLIGAQPGEVLVCDTTSIVLAKLVGAALGAGSGRRVVLSTRDNFPSDLFAAMGVARRFGAEVRVVEQADLPGALNEEVAVCCVTHVDFRTGARHDIPSIT
jgi:kynureninase